MSGPSIVDAREEDIPRILEIEQTSITPPWTHGALLGEIYRDDSFFAVVKAPVSGDPKIVSIEYSPRAPAAESEERREDMAVQGFVILRRMGDEAELLQIAVDKAMRRLGLADKLMLAALRYSLENELGSIFLEVRSSNEAAIALYKKHGFKPVSSRKDYYIDPVEDAVVMKRAQDT